MRSLKIALLVYGKMGKEIEQLALAKNYSIIAKIDNAGDWDAQFQLVKQADVAIDFSMPTSVKENILKCFELQIPLVVGTTGWYDDLGEIELICRKKQASFLWAGNFSIGMNIFLKVNAYLAEIMAKFPDYTAQIHEIHHNQKLDAPSGTAISIANSMIGKNDRLQRWALVENTSDIQSDVLPISYERIGKVPGTHQVSYRSAIDEISIQHEAKNRKGFALGAVSAAEWLVGKTGFFTMSDVLS